MLKYAFVLLFALLPFSASAEPVSAIMAIASMAASYGAAGTIAAMSLAQGLAFAGGAITLAGSVTGNKKLTQLGAVVGLAGGISALASSGSAAAGSAGSAEAAAGASSLQQTPTPAAEVAAGTAAETATGAGAVNAAADAAGAGSAADAAGLGTANLSSAPSASTGLASSAADYGHEGAVGLRRASGVGGGTPANRSLLSTLADKAKGASSFIKDNKELVNLGAGLVSGAADAYQDKSARNDQRKFILEQNRRYGESVSGISPIDQFINPNANVTVNPPANRMIPRRPLVGRPKGA